MGVKCTDISCKYNDKCKYKVKNLHFTNGITTTVFGERLRYLKCGNYEESEEYKRIKKAFEKIDLKSELLKGEQS